MSNALISAAILKAVNDGNGKAGWIKDIVPAVKALNVVPEGEWMEVRNCLGGLLKSKQAFRAAFDPYADDEYFVAPGTPGAR